MCIRDSMMGVQNKMMDVIADSAGLVAGQSGGMAMPLPAIHPYAFGLLLVVSPLVVGLICLLVDKRPFVRWHSVQAMVLFFGGGPPAGGWLLYHSDRAGARATDRHFDVGGAAAQAGATEDERGAHGPLCRGDRLKDQHLVRQRGAPNAPPPGPSARRPAAPEAGPRRGRRPG